MTRSSLASERFIGYFQPSPNATYAIVTNGQQVVYLPTTHEEIADYRSGEPVLIDMESRRIVGRDGATPLTCEIVTVESRPADHPHHAVIQMHDQLEYVRLHHELVGRQDVCQAGDQVLFDPVRKFVLGNADTQSDGKELLTNLDTLANVSRDDVGAIHPVIDEIIDRFRAAVEHPDWSSVMKVRNRCSYLMAGPTGTGKSFQLKLLINEIHDLVEAYTGHRTSRLIILDASHFWSPYFGETEQRIARWAAKLRQLGSQTLRGRDGRLIRCPVVITVEEAEGLFRGRGEPDGSGHLFDRPLSLFLQKTESLENALQVPIIWLATSNRADLADSAALRRIGMRRITFDMLRPPGVRAVLLKKVPRDMPMSPHGAPDADARAVLVSQVLGYLYGSNPPQEVAEVTLLGGSRQQLLRQDMVSPALLEEAVSAGVDAALRRSLRSGRLVGLDAQDVVQFLNRHFIELAPTLTPHNVAEYCPRLLKRNARQVREVRPLMSPSTRPMSLLLESIHNGEAAPEQERPKGRDHITSLPRLE